MKLLGKKTLSLTKLIKEHEHVNNHIFLFVFYLFIKMLNGNKHKQINKHKWMNTKDRPSMNINKRI